MNGRLPRVDEAVTATPRAPLGDLAGTV